LNTTLSTLLLFSPLALSDELLELTRLLGLENVGASAQVLAVDEDVGHCALAGLVGEVSLAVEEV
jgi:hypothetical protein